ncbi:ABC transporter substrate-binding protein [Zhihengliuella salsuginis]|uniref:Sugar ABC transporter substrate-binding protein n=1 Tax=Zhihengliuella salsuginis TaxID=578222 RepID=A0ABQ3GKI5_9MICC|nr:extracellular solute-binding protein [Zhihengliuella salsuginis]GHD06912.1 sugar ABC transporter substrate-binding protein [Zhihengliuella salsuginis]
MEQVQAAHPGKRRVWLARAAAVAAISALALTACGGGGVASEGGEGETVSLRFSWWGSDSRSQNTMAIIEKFEAENPDIDIQPEPNSFSGYWDKLATQSAASDAPDVMQMDLSYFREYADRGVLRDLPDVDTSKISEDLLSQGRTDEGQFGIPTGFASIAMMAHPGVFEEAGLELPDDTTWTWEDFGEITREIGEKVEGGYGSTSPFEPVGGFMNWLRQQDQHMTTEEGELGFDEADLQEYLEFQKAFVESGSYPDPTVIEEDRAAGNERSLLAQGKMGLVNGWSNLLPTASKAAGVDMVPLRMPSRTGNVEDNGLWHRVSMFLSASSETEHPEEAQRFIDFFVNSEEAGMENLTDRGLPANSDVREAVMATLEGNELTAAEFLNDIEDEVTPPEPVPTAGAAAFEDILHRYETEVYMDRQSVEEATSNAYAEMQAALE